MRISLRGCLGFAAMLLLCSCGGDNPSSADANVLDVAGLIEALEARGAEVTTVGPIVQPFFSVPGQVLRVNGEDVQAFEYASEAEAISEASLISPDGFTIGNTSVAWIATPHFFRMGRVIALYVGNDSDVLQRVEAVMGPQLAGG